MNEKQENQSETEIVQAQKVDPCFEKNEKKLPPILLFVSPTLLYWSNSHKKKTLKKSQQKV